LKPKSLVLAVIVYELYNLAKDSWEEHIDMIAGGFIINYFLVLMLPQHCKEQDMMLKMGFTIYTPYKVSNLQAAYAKPMHTISLNDIKPDPEILAPPARWRSGRPQKKKTEGKEARARYGSSAKDSCCSR